MPTLRRFLNRHKAFVAVVFVAWLAMLIFVADYVILPVLAAYPSVQVPSSCTDAISHLPADRTYPIPGDGSGTLLANDAHAAVVATANYGHTPFSSTAYLINTKSNQIVQSLTFSDDILAAGISDGTLYLFNDKILYSFDTTTGQPVQTIVKADNYRGLYTSGGARYLQSSFEMSELRRNGQVISHLKLHFTGIAFGCYFP